MSLHEPRCLVCGNPLDKGAPFKKDVRDSEVCSDKCYEIYTFDEDAFNRWYDELKRLAILNGISWTVSKDPEDHKDGYKEGLTPKEELECLAELGV